MLREWRSFKIFAFHQRYNYVQIRLEFYTVTRLYEVSRARKVCEGIRAFECTFRTAAISSWPMHPYARWYIAQLNVIFLCDHTSATNTDRDFTAIIKSSKGGDFFSRKSSKRAEIRVRSAARRANKANDVLKGMLKVLDVLYQRTVCRIVFYLKLSNVFRRRVKRPPRSSSF